jgi:hypothetical protein
MSDKTPAALSECEPKIVYVVWAESGNCIMWTKSKRQADECGAKYGRPVRTLCDPDDPVATAKEVQRLNEHLHARNDALRLAVSDMSAVMSRMVASIGHMDKLARNWEPDHSSGEDRAGWVRANDAAKEALRVQEQVARLLRA